MHTTPRETGDRYADEPGFCKSATTKEIAAQGHVLTPGVYIDRAAAEGDDEPFAEKMTRLIAALCEQMEEGARVDERIRQALVVVGNGW
jgi:type I restriction enzyme M protein